MSGRPVTNGDEAAGAVTLGMEEMLNLMPLPALILRGNKVASVNAQMESLLGWSGGLVGAVARDVLDFPQGQGDGTAKSDWTRIILTTGDGRKLDCRAAMKQFPGAESAVPPIAIHVLPPEMAASEPDSDELLQHMAPIVHEFRTPLHAIVGFSEIMIKQLFGEINDRYLEFAGDINSSAHHLLKIVDSTLDLSRLRLNKDKLDEGLVVMRDLVAKAINLIKPLADEKGIKIEIEEDSEFASVYADETRMMQVVLNLISNAVKYTKAGGAVSVTAHINANGEAVLEVQDTGVGMTPAEVNLAMKPFGRTEGALKSKTKGTGLGLSISEAIMSGHKGRIELESEKDIGTCARAILPSDRVLVTGSGGAGPGEVGLGSGLLSALAQKRKVG